MANIPLQYPFPYKTNNNTGFTNSVEFVNVTVLGDVTIDQNLTVAGTITTSDLTVGDDLIVQGNFDASVIRAFGVWDVPTTTVTGAGAWMGFDASGRTIFANRKSTAGQTNAFLWYTYSETNAFSAELMHLNGTRLEVGTRLDIRRNDETVRLIGVDHTYLSYYVGATRYGYTGFSNPGSSDMVIWNERPTGHVIIDMSNTSGLLRSFKPIILQETVTIRIAPGSATYSYILPSSAGTTGQVLTSAGAGNPLYWSAGGGGGGGTVTNVTATSPLGVTSGTTTPNISITSSTGSGAVVLQTGPTINGELLLDSPGTNDGFIKFTSGANINYIQSGLQLTTGSSADLRFTNMNAGATFMTIKDTGNVGIGTISPTQKLQVNGTVLAYGSGASDSRGFQSGNSSRVYTAGIRGDISNSYVIVDETALVDRLCITSAGNVGIGTVSPTQKLEVNGTVLAYGSGASDSRGFQSGNSSRVYTAGIRGDISNSYVIVDETALADRLCITSAGNVGIGTLSPTQKLDVNGPVFIKEQLFIDSAGTNDGFLRLTSVGNINYIQSALTQVSGSSADLRFTTMDATTTFMTIKDTGNVGIGTTTPGSKLAVSGTGAFQDSLNVSKAGTGVNTEINIVSGTVGAASLANTSTLNFGTVGGGGGTVWTSLQNLYTAADGYHIKVSADRLVSTSAIVGKFFIRIDSNTPTDCFSKLESDSGNSGLEIRAINGVAYLDMTAKTPSPGVDYDFRISKQNNNDVSFLNPHSGSFIFDKTVRATNFTTNGLQSFTYEASTFTPRLGAYRRPNGQLYELGVLPTATITATYVTQTGRYVKIGKQLTMNIELRWTIATSGLAPDDYDICIILPDAFNSPDSMGCPGACLNYPNVITGITNPMGTILQYPTKNTGGNVSAVFPVTNNNTIAYPLFAPGATQILQFSFSYVTTS